MADIIQYAIAICLLVGIIYAIYWLYCEYSYLCKVLRVYEIHDPAEIKSFEANVYDLEVARKQRNFATTLNQKNEPIIGWWFGICCDRLYVYCHNDWIVCPATATAKHRRWYKCEAYGNRMRDVLLELLKPRKVSEEKKE